MKFQTDSVYVVLMPDGEKTSAEKFTKEELKAWVMDNHEYPCEIFKCTPVKVAIRNIVEIEE